MLLTDQYLHSASIEISASAEKVFDYISKIENLGNWAFGAWNVTPTEKEGVFVGESLYGGSAYVTGNADPDRLQIDWEVGETPDVLLPRIVTRIFPASTLARGSENECLLSMISWRSGSADDDRWRLTCGSHEAEIFRIKHLMESVS